MHMRGEPTTMNQLDQYTDVTLDVIAELQQRVNEALNAGVKNIILLLILGLVLQKCAAKFKTIKRILEAW